MTIIFHHHLSIVQQNQPSTHIYTDCQQIKSTTDMSRVFSTNTSQRGVFLVCTKTRNVEIKMCKEKVVNRTLKYNTGIQYFALMFSINISVFNIDV